MTIEEKQLSERLLQLWQRDHQESRGSRCVRRLVGKLCLLGGRDCDCEPPHSDHVSIWRRHKDGKLVMAIQPYGAVEEDDMLEWFDFCNQRGLKFSISSGSWHYPGWTTLILFESR